MDLICWVVGAALVALLVFCLLLWSALRDADDRAKELARRLELARVALRRVGLDD